MGPPMVVTLVPVPPLLPPELALPPIAPARLTACTTMARKSRALTVMCIPFGATRVARSRRSRATAVVMGTRVSEKVGSSHDGRKGATQEGIHTSSATPGAHAREPHMSSIQIRTDIQQVSSRPNMINHLTQQPCISHQSVRSCCRVKLRILHVHSFIRKTICLGHACGG